MNEFKGTPGPWVDRGDTVIFAGKKRICVADCRDYTIGVAEARANACLIASAPDLLAALEALLAECEAYRGFDHEAGMLVDARKAIAKAKGKVTT